MGVRLPGRVNELFQWLVAPGMNPPQPVVAGGPVGTAQGCLAAVLPLLQFVVRESRK